MKQGKKTMVDLHTTCEVDPSMCPPIHPGETLAEDLMEADNLSVLQVADKTGLSVQEIQDFIEGKSSVTDKLASCLEEMFVISKKFWFNLQNSYEIELVDKEIANHMFNASAASVPITSAELNRQKTLLSFLSLTNIKERVGLVNIQKIVYRITKEAEISDSYIPEFNFVTQLHGPEDREITNTMDRMVDESLLDMVDSTNFNTRRYVLNEKGRDIGNRLLSKMTPKLQEKVTEVVDWAMSFKTLTEFMNDFYRLYPKFKSE